MVYNNIKYIIVIALIFNIDVVFSQVRKTQKLLKIDKCELLNALLKSKEIKNCFIDSTKSFCVYDLSNFFQNECNDHKNGLPLFLNLYHELSASLNNGEHNDIVISKINNLINGYEIEIAITPTKKMEGYFTIYGVLTISRNTENRYFVSKSRMKDI